MKNRNQNILSHSGLSSIGTSLCTITLCLLGATPAAQAASATWSATPADNLWSNAANWSASPVPGVGDTATFANTTSTTIDTGSISLGTLNFSGLTVANAVITIGGATAGTGQITFADGTTSATSFPGQSVVAINANIILGTAVASNTTFTSGNNRNLTIAGSITGGTGGTAAAKTLTISPFNSGSSSVTISGAITTGGATSLALSKTNAGILNLTNAGNSFTGGFSATTGTTNVSSLAALGSATTGLITLGSGNLGSAILNFTGSPGNISRQVQLGASNGAGIGTGTISNNAANGSTPLIFTNPTFISQVVGSVSVTRALTLGGANTDANEIQGIIRNNAGTSGLVGVTKTGAGTWTLSGANTYTGATILNAGTLSVGASSNLGAAASNLVFNGGTLQITGTALTNFSGIGHAVSFTGGVGLDINNAANTFTADQALNQLTGGFTKSGNGTAILNQANTYPGVTSVTAGTLQTGNATALGFGGLQTTTSGGTTIASGATLDLAGTTGINEPITLSGTGVGGNGALINSSGTPAIIGTGVAGLLIGGNSTGSGYSSAPTVTISGAGGATATATIGVTAASFGAPTVTGTVTSASAVITGGGGTGATATITTAGVLTITNPGTGYTSAPTIAVTVTGGGSISFAATNATDFTVSGVQMTAAGSGYTTAPTYTFSGNAVAGTSTLSSVILAADSSAGGSGDTIVNAVVSESGSARALTKVGAGTLTLAGANTYTGATSVTTGTLLVNGNSSGATGAVTVNGGTLGGIGTLGGAVTVAAAGSLAPGNSAVGTLTLASDLTVTAQASGTGKLNFQLDTVAASDKIAVGGAFTVGASVLGFSDFNFSALAGLTNGTYPLVTGASSVGGTLDAANLTGTVGAGTGTLQFNGTALELVVSGIGGDPYASWSGGAPFDGDANNDGVQNGLAWLLGAANPNVSALGLLPAISQSGGALQMSFSMLNAAGRGTSQIELQHSSDLGISDPWNGPVVPSTSGGPTSGVTFVITPGTPLDTVVATVSSSEAAGGKLFGRLKGMK